MQPYQDRVIQEHDELSRRLEKFITFINRETFEAVPLAEQVRMRLQKHYMTAYRDILANRIAHFKDYSS